MVQTEEQLACALHPPYFWCRPQPFLSKLVPRGIPFGHTQLGHLFRNQISYIWDNFRFRFEIDLFCRLL